MLKKLNKFLVFVLKILRELIKNVTEFMCNEKFVKNCIRNHLEKRVVFFASQLFHVESVQVIEQKSWYRGIFDRNISYAAAFSWFASEQWYDGTYTCLTKWGCSHQMSMSFVETGHKLEKIDISAIQEELTTKPQRGEMKNLGSFRKNPMFYVTCWYMRKSW